jgi:2-dehydro-3-deoxyphosphogalactonate aldolase
MKAFVDAGANGFGLGSALFTPGLSAAEVAANASRFAQAWRTIAGPPA